MNFKLVADKQSEQALREFTSLWQDLPRRIKPHYKRIVGTALAKAFTQNFETEGQGQWDPLSRSWTVPERRRLGFAGRHPILQRTKNLKRSVTDKSHPLHIRDVYTQGKSRVVLEMGSKDERYRMLHFGGVTSLNTRIPPRPMAILHDHQIGDINRAIVFAIQKSLE